jgi:hypothetical protein
MTEERKCKKGHLLTPDNLRPNGKGGYVTCRQCANNYARDYGKKHRKKIMQLGEKWRKNNKNKVEMINRRSKLKYKYDLTPEDINQKLKTQDNKCANPGCRTTVPGGRWNVWMVDHNHITNKIRGLVCHRCNIALGMLREDETKILGLVEYLRQYRE